MKFILLTSKNFCNKRIFYESPTDWDREPPKTFLAKQEKLKTIAKELKTLRSELIDTECIGVEIRNAGLIRQKLLNLTEGQRNRVFDILGNDWPDKWIPSPWSSGEY